MPGKWMDSERARQPATHFAGCWRLAGHHRCAVEEIERLDNIMASTAAAEVDLAERLQEAKREYGELARRSVKMSLALERAEKAAAVWKRAAKRLWARRDGISGG